MMIKGKKVYDCLTGTWSTGYWLPIYVGREVVGFLPVWNDYNIRRRKNDEDN